MAHAQQMQEQMRAAQEEILATIVIGQAGNGLVSVSMEGSGKVTAVNIDPKVIDPEDAETLQDLVVGAFNDAQDQIARIAEEKMGPLSQGLEGFDMGSLM
jgi:hypothetical protein